MNIAFDAKRYFHNPTGLGHYSRTLVNGLIEYFPDNQYFLVNPKQSNIFSAPDLNNVFEINPPDNFYQVFTSLWRSKGVVEDLVKSDIQLYHGLSHEIPSGIQKTNIKSVVTIHDLIFEKYPKQYNWIDVWIYRKKIKAACKYSNKIIAISQQTKRDLIELYNVPQEKIEVCYQSCNPAFSVQLPQEHLDCIRKRYNLPNEFLLYVGSIIERKNLLNICKAIKLLKGSTLTVPPLIVIGEGGHYKAEVENYILEENLEREIIFLSDDPVAKSIISFKSAEDFPSIYQMATAMIYPSIYEGFGIPVLEALFSRIPVITSNISCLPEAGGEGAFLIDPYQPSEIAAAIETILTNPTLVQEKIQKGSIHAQKFDNKLVTSAVMNVYRKLV